jgi:serine palmitoyltransferase
MATKTSLGERQLPEAGTVSGREPIEAEVAAAEELQLFVSNRGDGFVSYLSQRSPTPVDLSSLQARDRSSEEDENEDEDLCNDDDELDSDDADVFSGVTASSAGRLSSSPGSDALDVTSGATPVQKLSWRASSGSLRTPKTGSIETPKHRVTGVGSNASDRWESERSATRKTPMSPARMKLATSARRIPQRYSMAAQYVSEVPDEMYAEVPLVAALITYAMYAVVIVLGYLRDALSKILKRRRYAMIKPQGCAPLLSDFEDFYTRRLYRRIEDCWSRPICSAPGAYIDVIERRFRTPKERELLLQKGILERWATKPPQLEPVELIREGTNEVIGWIPQAPFTAALTYTGRVKRCLNLSSYNYLGYGEVPGGVDASVLETLDRYGVATGAARESGCTAVLRELEQTVARFVGKPDAIVIGMGFATNSMIIPAIIGKGGLIISDELNHASIVAGARSSGARIRVFRHNDAKDLERVLRSAIAEGQPRSHRQWRRILVVVEGIYSMEGAICNLREIARVTRKYKAFLFVDEAHSIGALGERGRGVCEFTGVDPQDVDILMGTFTKSFGAVGGYVAASRELVAHLRRTAPGALYASTMSPACAKHILFAMRQISGEDGTDIGRRKLTQLRENSLYFRRRLLEMGLQTIGSTGSPVIPIMLYVPSVIAEFSRECLKRGLAVVVVGFPATPLILSRSRICISAAHSREDLDFALNVIEQVADLLKIRYLRK